MGGLGIKFSGVFKPVPFMLFSNSMIVGPHILPPHDPIPNRVFRFISLALISLLSIASFISLNVISSHLHMTVSSFANSYNPGLGLLISSSTFRSRYILIQRFFWFLSGCHFLFRQKHTQGSSLWRRRQSAPLLSPLYFQPHGPRHQPHIFPFWLFPWFPCAQVNIRPKPGS